MKLARTTIILALGTALSAGVTLLSGLIRGDDDKKAKMAALSRAIDEGLSILPLGSIPADILRGIFNKNASSPLASPIGDILAQLVSAARDAWAAHERGNMPLKANMLSQSQLAWRAIFKTGDAITKARLGLPLGWWVRYIYRAIDQKD